MSRPYDTLAWQAVDWQRPFTVEEVWEMLSHLATLKRRSPIIWEARGRNGQIRYQIGAYSQSIGSITDAIRAHGDIRTHAIPPSSRKKVEVVQTIKVSHPVLSLTPLSPCRPSGRRWPRCQRRMVRKKPSSK